jgi:hypothetical protein
MLPPYFLHSDDNLANQNLPCEAHVNTDINTYEVWYRSSHSISTRIYLNVLPNEVGSYVNSFRSQRNPIAHISNDTDV